MNVEEDDNLLIYQYHQKIVNEYLDNLKKLDTKTEMINQNIAKYQDKMKLVEQWYLSTKYQNSKLDEVYPEQKIENARRKRRDDKRRLAKIYGGVPDEEYVFGSRTTDVINEDIQNADMINEATSNLYFENKYA
jgi:hypothetical protein